MIQLNSKYDCCGCSACAQSCPKECIIMRADEEGFLYPQIDTDTCINCGLCERVCPVINQSLPQKPHSVYAAKNKNEDIRLKSSSGGLFTLLAERTINNGGVVFGAKFNDDWSVIHDYTETIDGIKIFRGSKYLQSNTNICYKSVRKFLKEGRKVLFSGTPCQIAGLHLFLNKEYPNLTTVDIICHGVPSPLVWHKYVGLLNSLTTSPLSTTSSLTCLSTAGTTGRTQPELPRPWCSKRTPTPTRATPARTSGLPTCMQPMSLASTMPTTSR